MMTSNQNKSNSQLLPVDESSAVSGTEEMIACLLRDSFPPCVGTRAGKQVNSHKWKELHKAPVWGRQLHQRLSRGKGGPDIASTHCVWFGLIFCRPDPGLALLCSLQGQCFTAFWAPALFPELNGIFSTQSCFWGHCCYSFRVRFIPPFPFPAPRIISVSQTQ